MQLAHKMKLIVEENTEIAEKVVKKVGGIEYARGKFIGEEESS